MKKNFNIGQANELIIAEKVYDLHNCYDYVGLLLLNRRRTLELIFEPNKDYGQDSNPIRIHFDEVDFLEFSEGFGSSFIIDVEEIGYKSPGDNDDSWLLAEKQSSSSDHIFLRFSEDEFIRVYSKSVELKEHVAASVVLSKRPT